MPASSYDEPPSVTPSPLPPPLDAGSAFVVPAPPDTLFPSGGLTDCGDTLQLCSYSCVDVSSNAENCGRCGKACTAQEVCSNSQCVCADGYALCDGTCVTPSLGACGPCGDSCPATFTCDDMTSHAADWPTLGGDMLRSGYNRGELGTPPLVDDWAVSLIDAALNPVMVSGSKVFATGHTRFEKTGPLLALDIATGDTLWTKDFGSVSDVGQPTVLACRVYVQQSAGMDAPSRFWVLDTNSGDALWGRQFASQWERYWSPTITADAVYADGGEYGGLYGFARQNGELWFENQDLEQYDEWVAAAYGGDIYTFVAGNLRRHDAQSGSVKDSVHVTWNWNGWSMYTGPVFAEDGTVYVIAPPTLYAFQATTKKLLWQYVANVSGMPALADGLVLAFDSQMLAAFDAKTGAAEWTALATEALEHAPIAANGYAYVASESTTYAVDLKTGNVVWQVPEGGWLSIGGGRLFIARSDGILHSYRLTQATTN